MDIQISQIVFQLINFGVVFAALTYLVYKPVLKTLEQRSKKISESQEAAEELLKQKADMDKTAQKTITQAKKEANTLMTDAKQTADKKKEELMKKAKDEVQQYLDEEKNKWQQEKVQMIKQLEKDMSQAVFNISEKVLGQSIDAKLQTKLVDQGIAEVVKSL